MGKYAIGLDFGTLSARAVLCDVCDGREAATAEFVYPHGVMDEALPTGKRLGADWALEHPGDYIEALKYLIPAVLNKAGASAREVAGVGVDFTACTPLPLKADGTPLCFLEEFKRNPHAYVKLWKHHAAREYAERITEVAAARGERFLARNGGKISSEFLHPKIWQVLSEAPEVYHAAELFAEAGDWIVWLLTGKLSRSACMAGYKALWAKGEGYPSKEFLRALDPRLENLTEQKLRGEVLPVGAKAGGISEYGAALTGLEKGTPVAVAVIDAHACAPGVGAVSAGSMFMIMGTSTCHMLLSERAIDINGICGVVEDGIVPGLVGYEAGQCCVGDHFSWFIDNCLPKRYFDEAERSGGSIYALLGQKAGALRPGESGLLALDWWNGNRSVLNDAGLSGALFGFTLATKPEDIYRALVEATAFGTRVIIESFEKNGLPISGITAAGGIATKDPFVMQIYADVLGRIIKIARSPSAVAVGSAVYGTVAAGLGSIEEMSAKMGGVRDEFYTPSPTNKAVYERLYGEYLRLHDCFGRGENDVLRRLREMREQR